MAPVFLIATELAPHDAAWPEAVALAAAVADAAAPILGFHPEVQAVSFADEIAAAREPAGAALPAVLADLATQGRTLAFILPAILELSVFQRQALVELVRESQRRAPSLA